jgi:hypothetical protein
LILEEFVGQDCILSTPALAHSDLIEGRVPRFWIVAALMRQITPSLVSPAFESW